MTVSEGGPFVGGVGGAVWGVCSEQPLDGAWVIILHLLAARGSSFDHTGLWEAW